MALLAHIAVGSAQLAFKTGRVTLSAGHQDVVYQVEVADDAHSRRVGLMYRSSLPENQGMLLLHEAPQQVNIWMKNTFLPLDIIYVDSQGYIVKIVEHATPQSTARMSSEGPVKAVLELNAGQVRKQQISIGDRLRYQVYQSR